MTKEIGKVWLVVVGRTTISIGDQRTLLMDGFLLGANTSLDYNTFCSIRISEIRNYKSWNIRYHLCPNYYLYTRMGLFGRSISYEGKTTEKYNLYQK